MSRNLGPNPTEDGIESYRMLYNSAFVYDIWHSSSTSGVFWENLIGVVRLDDIKDVLQLGSGVLSAQEIQ